MEGSASRRSLAGAASACLLSLLVLWSAAVGSPAVATETVPVPVRVGVVLDLTSETGRKGLTCISMALADFYLRHPSYTTRVELRIRDSRGELVTAAYAAEELMAGKNAQVQAIISPETSPEVELLASIARRSNIPILSISATSPALSSSQARFFVRTAANISSQAAPIAAILEAFAWRAAVLLHEDSPYSAGILSALVHAFQGHGHRARGVMDSVAVPADATDSRLDAALLDVRDMPVRVYVVHAPPALAARLFRRAVVAGMMSEGHVWIATTGVGDEADGLGLNPGDIDHMQGVVSLRPQVPATDQVRSFSRRFKAKFRRQNPAPDDGDPSVPVSLLWLYDTAWAAAAAAEAAFRTTAQGTTQFLDALLHTTFRGLAGRFRLVDGQRQISAYEIVNIIGNGARTVGFCKPESGITMSLHSKISGNKALKQILWPGETAAAPLGWSESPNGRPLRVAVPVKSAFSQFVEISGDPSTDQRVTGYCIDVFHAVLTKLNYPVDYQYVPVNDSSESYDALVNLVHDKKADAVAGDVTITASRMKLVSFTMPFADPGWSMIVADKKNSNSMWIFIKPLTPELWFTSLVFFFFTGFVVWAIEHRINTRFRGTPWKQFGILFYFAFSTMVFSHSKEKLESNLSKFVVIMWVFAVLILTTSYTANLTSMLTVRQLQPTINNLRERDVVGYQEGSFIKNILKEMGFSEARLRGYSTMDEYADALEKGSEHGGVTAIFDEVPYLRLFLSRYCEGYAMAGPTYKSGGFGFVFPVGSPLVPDVSRAILELAAEEELARIESKWFGHPGACVSGAADDARLGVRRFGGLFLVNAVVLCLALLIHLATFVSPERARRDADADAEAEAAGQLELPWLRAWFQRLHTREYQDRRGESGAATEQEGAMRECSTPVDDAAVYGRNAASAPVSEEILAPSFGGLSVEQSIGPGTCRLDMHVNVAAA